MEISVSIKKRLSDNFSLAVDFEVRAMEDGRPFLGILGTSGCGKSMTLKCIAGIETPDEGYIVINGRTMFDSRTGTNLKPKERKIGILFQDYALFPRMTVLQNITVGLRIPDKVVSARAWINALELTGLEHLYPDQLSGGQKQRTALARMLIREPDAVLLDEPFSALDKNMRELMQNQFPDFLHTCENVILVTHSRDEAYRLCGEIMVMEDGKILGKGPTDLIFNNPRLANIARITGCKNIAPAHKTGAKELYVPDWDLMLETAVPVPDDITFVGIRAHDFKPVAACAKSVCNRLRLKVIQQSEDPFEHVVIFAPVSTKNTTTKPLWWKYSKYLEWDIPQELYVPPEALLLLK